MCAGLVGSNIDPMTEKPDAPNIEERLVFTHSTDNLPLAGVSIGRQGGQATALVWIHGGASNFYQRSYVRIGRDLAKRGFLFVSANTRGHDAYALMERGEETIPAGTCFERFDEAPRDIEAWVNLATSMGAERIVLLGHSQGASKVVLYQAERNDPRIVGLVAASPPTFGRPQPERIALAVQMVSDGRGAELLPHLEGSPVWNLVSAQTLFTREDILRHAFESETRQADITRVRCPVLLLHGEAEEFEPAWLKRVKANGESATLQVEMIEGADHNYSGVESRVAARIAEWVQSLAQVDR